MDGDEQIGLMLVGNLHPLIERDKVVGVTRQAHLNVVMLCQAAAHAVGDLQHDVLLFGAFMADRAGVNAAVAGVQHHDFFGIGRFGGRGGFGDVLLCRRRAGAKQPKCQPQPGNQQLAARRGGGQRRKLQEFSQRIEHCSSPSSESRVTFITDLAGAIDSITITVTP